MKQNILLIIFLLGLFLPTSIGGVILPSLLKVYVLAAIPIYLILIIIFGKGTLPKTRGIIALLINLVLWGATLISHFTTYAYGNYIFFFLFSLMICLNLKEEELTENKLRFVTLVHIINIALCLLIVIQNQTIINFFINNFSLYYPEMVPYALAMKKPIIMFAAHSVAGFYLFIFFYLSFSSYEIKRKLIHLIISFAYLYFIFSLNSNGGYIFFFIGFVQCLHFFIKNNPLKSFFVSFLAFFALILSLLINPSTLVNSYQKYSALVSSTLTSSNNGLAGRYFSGGILDNNLVYFKDHLFLPVGFGNSSELFFGDSGLVEYLLRGSFILAILMYLGLFFFLKRNLFSKKIAYLLFVAFIIMDIGAPLLISFRALFMLPFLIVFLNKLTTTKLQIKSLKALKN